MFCVAHVVVIMLGLISTVYLFYQHKQRLNNSFSLSKVSSKKEKHRKAKATGAKHLYTHTHTNSQSQETKTNASIFLHRRRETTDFSQPDCFTFRFAKLISDKKKNHFKRAWPEKMKSKFKKSQNATLRKYNLKMKHSQIKLQTKSFKKPCYIYLYIAYTLIQLSPVCTSLEYPCQK